MFGQIKGFKTPLLMEIASPSQLQINSYDAIKTSTSAAMDTVSSTCLTVGVPYITANTHL